MLNLLVIGGTQFVGRHMVQAALDRGHHVTLFNRGLSGAEVFPGIETILGDRDHDLGGLSGRRFDAVLDTCAYVPRQVEAVADVLSEAVDRYLYVSSVSAYRPSGGHATTEQSPRFGPDDLDDPTAEAIDDRTYGPLKAMCEDVATRRYANRAIVLRPTYVVGPHDTSDRFTWWVRQAATRATVVAAGPANAPIQVIDGRDLGNFAVGLLEAGEVGAFNGVGPAAAISWRDLLAVCLETLGGPASEIAWLDPIELGRQRIDVEAAFPMWATAADAAMLRCDPTRSVAAGLALRPVADTVADLWAWDDLRGHPSLAVGLSDGELDELARSLGGR